MFLPWTMTLGQWLFEQQIKLKEKKQVKEGRKKEEGLVLRTMMSLILEA